MNADKDFQEKALTHEVIGAFYKVYNVLGYGFLEAVYKRAMAHELTKRGVRVDREYLSQSITTALKSATTGLIWLQMARLSLRSRLLNVLQRRIANNY